MTWSMEMAAWGAPPDVTPGGVPVRKAVEAREWPPPPPGGTFMPDSTSRRSWNGSSGFMIGVSSKAPVVLGVQ